MKFFQCLFIVITTILLFTGDVLGGAAACKGSVCKIVKNCRCWNAGTPLVGGISKWPQLISLTFDEAVTENLYNQYWSPLLLYGGLFNPDNVPIGATFFVPHEYSNYKIVNDLYNYGFEIGVNSISKNYSSSYWLDASEELLVEEFGGAKQIISKFANIDEVDIVGVRTPYFHLAGNNSFNAYIKSGLSYDSSWPSLTSKRLFPYTLDYATKQNCPTDAVCPSGSFPGFWVLPINNFAGDDDVECNILANCGYSGDADEIVDWLLEQIDNIRKSTRVPINLIVSSYWFQQSTQNYDALLSVLQQTLNRDEKDTYIVTQKQVLDFMKSPKPLGEFETNFDYPIATCQAKTCVLQKDGEERRMVSCVPCPSVYPWVGNPNGDA